MFSKSFELSGFGLIAAGIAAIAGVPAGLIFSGCALLFVGSTTDDAQFGALVKRSWGWVRYVYYRQVLREALKTDVTIQPRSPHPAIQIDPETEAWAEQAARNHKARVRSRRSGVQPPEESDLERLA